MKKIFYLGLFFVSIFHISGISSEEGKCVRGCRSSGFFAEFFWTLNHLDWCQKENITPVVYWDHICAYYSPSGYNDSHNCWEYYFEPVSDLEYEPSDTIYRQFRYSSSFSTIWWYKQYIQNMDQLSDDEITSLKAVPLTGKLAERGYYPSENFHLYAKNFRKYVRQEIIDRFIRIKPSIRKKIEDFYLENMEGFHVIGIHLRGKFLFDEVGVVPIEMICDEANSHAGKDTIFLVATDQFPLLELSKELLNGKVIHYECYRQEETTSPNTPATCTPQMGEDVLIEAQLLSLCDDFIHTISNVSTAVLYFNPDLPHTALYCENVL